MLKEKIVFAREFFEEFQTTGAFFPTSQRAAKALSRPLIERQSDDSLSILELGPGTGSVTVEILKLIRPKDKLAICEINPEFMGFLKKRIQNNANYLRNINNISFYQCPMQNLPEDQKFDIVICALPFLNFDLDTVTEIFAKLKKLANPKGIMTYYQYIGLKKFGKIMRSSVGRQQLRDVSKYFEDVVHKANLGCTQVWFNLLPINVYTLRLSEL
ncbi:MAG TPA: methyltransferase domain-containing protein [Oligoflexia bacterium]|nr:methyltransferase domain-containing protein [Oligoflexia bacterium]HMP27665.1 methyltransferase domain-containing protein [Oligoflexia bacterium]